jgi:hypothetical protein
MWKSCPVASDEVLKVPQNNRPMCPYEAQQFEAALGAVEERMARLPGADALDGQFGEHVALLQVMVTRASHALSACGFTDVVKTQKDEIGASTSQVKLPSALQAFMRLSTEYRRCVKMLEVKGGEKGKENEDLRGTLFGKKVVPSDSPPKNFGERREESGMSRDEHGQARTDTDQQGKDEKGKSLGEIDFKSSEYPKGVRQNSPGSGSVASATLGMTDDDGLPCKGYTKVRSDDSEASEGSGGGDAQQVCAGGNVIDMYGTGG